MVALVKTSGMFSRGLFWKRKGEVETESMVDVDVDKDLENEDVSHFSRYTSFVI